MTSKMDSKDGINIAIIPQFYAGREVFITGATGFVGKVLVERLLSTCPDICRLHLLITVKRGESPEARLDKLKKSPIYDVLHKNKPDQLKKLSLVHGDFNEVDLGITDKAIDALRDVSIVFHLAASVNMEENLLTAVKVNTIATMALLDICHRLPKIAAFIHVSTGYSNAERTLIEETVYPLPRPLDTMIEESLKGGQMTLDEIKR
ncbi:unnamed protein product [Diatraea saccharalis]|uniref:Fatty acyl-CoA reductase n=1 Tax=Diatraea saccharalis TaxID=40085 RepID=A0A9N9R7J2_9NEOP|nr:unnamed protein product [Diatraea saccharalis]